MVGAGEAVVVDVRGAEERAVSTISSSIALEEMDAADVLASGKILVTFCVTGKRGCINATSLMAATPGLKVVTLRGGIAAWTLSGQPVFDADGGICMKLHTGPMGKAMAPCFPEGYEVVLPS